MNWNQRMKGTPLRGIFVIVPTPFNEDLAVDYDALDRINEFCVQSGSHGVVTPANASEQPMLTDAERQKIIRRTVARVNGRIPVVAGISSVSVYAAAENARMACAEGADALMAMPPYLVKASETQIREYFERIDRNSDVPVIIQNYGGAIGTELSADFMIKLCAENEHVQYIKEESALSSQRITRTLELAKGLPSSAFLGVMGGKAGKFIIEEYRRGACGCMPACEIADIHVQIWEACEEGRFERAQSLLNRSQPLLNFESIYGSYCYKEVLRRRGVIDKVYSRMADIALDPYDVRELDRIMGEIADLFRV